MSFDPTQERHDALLAALHSIAKEIHHMAEAQALADLSAAITAITDAVTAAIAAKATDNSPAIEAQAAKLLQLASDLKAAITSPPAA